MAANEYRIGTAGGAMIVATLLGVVGLATQRAAFAVVMFAVAFVAAIVLVLFIVVSRGPHRKRSGLG